MAESCYKLGDFLRDGRGCEVDPGKAYRWYRRAYDLGKSDAPVCTGGVRR
ncbi:SEL1-like repeat protein [Tractidigestivibacter montrealensis]